MNVIKQFITNSAFVWADAEIKNQSSQAGFILRYIQSKNKLRDAQIQSLKIYLWYKCEAGNKSLVDLLESHYRNDDNGSLRNVLLDFADEIESEKLRRQVLNSKDKEIKDFLIDFFGGYKDVTNILFSLPMGAGKTFVMASMIYIDLYFNLNNDDSRFAHNFLIFAPSGLKSSVIPSLRTIEKFDPEWILPSDIGHQIKKQLKFVVLDVSKTAKKSNKIENPNARKVQEALIAIEPKGYIFVTNAEKVILEKVVDDPFKGTLFEVADDEKSRQENELRHLLAKIPRLSILIDEVHHTQKEENKLKNVINNQFNQGNLTNIIGFTGTPYFKRKVVFNSTVLTLDQIPNTIYHYELKNGVRNFLKQPVIKSFSSDTKTIVRASLEEFYEKDYKKTFIDGRVPKLAIYCANIERLEEDVLPIVIDFYKDKNLDSNEILKYYGSDKKSKTGKKYSLDKDAEVEFSKLDTPYSNKRIILLCQIGKEGWDCQSLTGVVLSGEGDSPKNMVLQTSCRCLREVEDAEKEIGMIFLNQQNYKHLEKELMDAHKISIKDFEAGKEDEESLVRVDRREYLKLPQLEFNQFIIEREPEETSIEPKTKESLQNLIQDLRERLVVRYFTPETVNTRNGFEVRDASVETRNVLESTSEDLTLSQFHIKLIKASYGAITFENLLEHSDVVRNIHITITRGNKLLLSYNLQEILSSLIQAFVPQLSVKIREVIKQEKVSWLIADINKNPISHNAKIYPNNIDFIQKIEEYDRKKTDTNILTQQEDEKIRQFEVTKQASGNDLSVARFMDLKIEEAHKSKLPIKNKDRSFHYIPYEFSNSKFEQDILEHIFQHNDFIENNLEVYFNGDRFLSNFKVKIYKSIDGQWKLIQDKYTPDFLIIQRGKGKIIKTLIIETKGAHLAHDFSNIKDFMGSKFLDMNKGRFDFLYLEDGKDMSYHTQIISDKINQYFKS